MRILIVNTYSISRSTGLIARSLLDFLRNCGHQAKLCCRGYEEQYIADDDVINLGSKWISYGAALWTRIHGIEGDFMNHNTNKLITIIDEFHPDIVQLYSLHGYYLNQYKLLRYLKNKNIPCVYSMIDEHAYMGRCCYSRNCNQFKTECVKCPDKRCKEYPTTSYRDRAYYIFHLKKNIYDDYNKIVFTGPMWVYQRAKESALLKNKKIVVLDEPIDFGKYFYPKDISSLRKQYNVTPETKVVLNVSNMRMPAKGGRYFLQVAERLLNEKNLLFICIGYNESIRYSVPTGMITIPYVTSQEVLAQHMSLADVFVHCSTVDTQPNVCLNALGCGTPIVGFDEMGNSMIVPKDSLLGKFVKNRDIDALAGLIKSAPKKTNAIIKECHEYAVGRYSSEVVFTKLLKIYNDLLNINNDSV